MTMRGFGVFALLPWLVIVGSVLTLVTDFAGAATLTKSGNRFYLDGQLFDMWGVRVASASQNQTFTDQLIANLDEYNAYGVNTVTIFFQGSSAVASDPFSPDGASINSGHLRRMKSLIAEADRRGMAVIVGIFYQNVATPRLLDWSASVEAVRTVTRELMGFSNIMINIANEAGGTQHWDKPWSQVSDPHGVIELCEVVQSMDPSRLCGGGGFDSGFNEIVGRSPSIDALLFDTAGPESSGALHDQYVAAGVVGKPLVNVETFGAWSRDYGTNTLYPQGVVPDFAKAEYYREIEEAAARPGLSVFIHNSPWFQGPSVGNSLRYDLGGQGTPSDPGMRFYFDHVRRIRFSSAPSPPPVPPTEVVMQAEGMAATGYIIDRASPTLVMLRETASLGQLTQGFAGASGEYDVVVNLVAEDDGQSQLDVYADATLLTQISYPLAATSRWPFSIYIPKVRLEDGSQITLVGHVGLGSGRAHARVDSITFIPLDPASAP